MNLIEEQQKLQEQRVKFREHVVETYGTDDFEDTDMLLFFKQFEKGETLFTYVAVKSNGFWYVTGQGDRMTWIDFWEFFEKDNLLEADNVFVNNDEWIPLFDFEE